MSVAVASAPSCDRLHGLHDFGPSLDIEPRNTAGVAPDDLYAADPTPTAFRVVAPGIKVHDTEFTIERMIMDRLIEDQAALSRQIRLVPESENGTVIGVRILGVRRDTLLGALGIENGDILRSVNGFDITTPEKALRAYAHLRRAEHLELRLRRGRSDRVIRYTLE